MGSIQQPLLIQYDPKHSTHNNDKVPLVLFHDGGGTIFNYFLLRDLKRQVYGIFDPRFELDEAWPGGLDEMADHYAELVLSLTCDSIILGGWSLGGMLSIKIAERLSRLDGPQVVGIVMIDTPNPEARKTEENWGSLRAPRLPSSYFRTSGVGETSLRTRHLVQNSMLRATSMIQDWSFPEFGTDESFAYQQHKREADCNYLYRPLHGNWQHKETTTDFDDDSDFGSSTCRRAMQNSTLPPAILLRCIDYVPAIKTRDPVASVASVDRTRESLTLGWEMTEPCFVRAVIDVAGHHFNLFRDEWLTDLTASVALACEMLPAVAQA